MSPVLLEGSPEATRPHSLGDVSGGLSQFLCGRGGGGGCAAERGWPGHRQRDRAGWLLLPGTAAGAEGGAAARAAQGCPAEQLLQL